MDGTTTRRPGKRRGPRPRLSRAIIGEAAARVGFAGLSLSAVGAHLGVAHTALYRYVRDRDDLVAAAVERLMSPHDPADGHEDWRRTCTASAWAHWDLYLSHDGLAEAVSESPAARAVLARHADALVRALITQGVPPDLAVLAADSVLDLIRDSVRTMSRLAHLDPEALRERLDARFPGPDERAIADTMYHALAEDPRGWVDRKLQVVLDGIAVRLGGPDRPHITRIRGG